MKKCFYCGKKIKDDAKFCAHCGKEVNNVVNAKKIKSKYSIKDIMTGLIAILLYFIMMIGQAIPLQLMGVDISNMNQTVKVLYMLGYELLTIIILICIFYNPLKQMWSDFKKNHKYYFKNYFYLWFILLGLMMFSNLIVSGIVGTETSANEEAINTMFKVSPLYIYLSAVVYAPIVEELTFRLAIRKLFKNDYLFIAVSGISFGLLHVIGSPTILEYLYIIPYAIPGFIFAYILVKTKNIFNTIGLHFIHNGIMMSLQIIASLFM